MGQLTTPLDRGSDASVRRIVGLALPALVVLAAEPLYVLVDTAVVGHLGRIPLAGLAIGGTVMTIAAWIGTVVAYGTTGRAARRFGAGDRAAAVAEGVQASWLALAAGLVLVLGIQIGAEPLARAIAGTDPDVAETAARWLRVASLGAPGLLLAAAGNGWLRGVQDTRRPLFFVLGPNLLSAVLCPLLVYPVGLGLIGSAVANAVAQTLSGLLFVGALIAERVSLRPQPRVIARQLVLSRDLLVRGLAFQASFLSATAVAARFGAATVAAHQIAIQLWFFIALVLDALAIAAQSLIGATLGGDDAAGARWLARRITLISGICGIAFAVVVAAGAAVIPSWFSADPLVRDQAMIAWPWFVAMLPVAGLVFALDGVLIGAGDVRYLRNVTIAAAVGAFLPAIWTGYLLDLGLGGIWAGLSLFMVVRLATLLWRIRSGRWAVVGAVR
ncbi:MATE family efflux transporter [Micromonospora polyrhachis]|uniref:Putative MATE family efflux protein n=1 Tax=Micromonospora polyrhachis TaxID=1282883 RepID=A0A7W7SMB7_9ACTN|nr:MATE family efflux transporter [Micromonospora polyrhachis]MBB4957419.1 putative MATE family efflux protein [Micromonospora polyrhachis]